VKRSSVIVLLLLVILIAGCARTQDSPVVVAASERAPVSSNSVSDQDANTAAISGAIDKHLRANSGINMSVMDMTVSHVQIIGDQAQANAEFHLKQGGTSMFITYKLERHAGDWMVLSNQPSGGQFTHPPMDKTHSGAVANPAAQNLPDVSGFLKGHTPPASTSP